MRVYMMQELQADRGVVQNKPAQIMETMNPTMHCHPTGQKQVRGASLMPARRSNPHTFLSPLPTSRALFLRIRNSYNFLHVIKSYLNLQEAQQVVSGIKANTKNNFYENLIFTLFEVISHNINGQRLQVKL